MFFVYILRCADDTFYVGMTSDLESRVSRHNTASAVGYTATRGPVVLVYSERFPTIKAARIRERQLKRWSAKKKAALVAGDLKALKELSKRHEP